MSKKLLLLIASATLLMSPAALMGLSSDLAKKLEAAEYVYISSTRKDGTPREHPPRSGSSTTMAPFTVGTRATSWRVKRIGWGRPQAKIAVGKADGPSFSAKGEIVGKREIQDLLMKTFATKYPKGWERYAESFRTGFKDGSRVVVKYTPITQ